ncbi:alkaline phosphatase [Teichococcus vastitatis]|uniref:Alkaline phosphatase n=1 Tax=Teichococcus vastitatis TaxID=2307076 RepID=A0ABS9W5F3_9PROT|nr:alkaline phosphatase [Pseudoroseomonas vastitatis]MCI0754521.1 alkaline phosphatase [Pseudoroseomonas vastitatis]
MTANPAQAKNVILLVSDGASPGTWDAASYYQHGALGQQAYDDFPVQGYMTTYPLTTSSAPTYGAGNPEGEAPGYNPLQAWNAAPAEGTFDEEYAAAFVGYEYLRENVTDSAAAGTALSTGVKTYNNAISYDDNGQQLMNIGDYAVESGRALGVVTSVQWSHATPAAFAAHNESRNDYEGISKEMIESGKASVIMGAGHPFYDENGEFRIPTSEDDYRYVGGAETFAEVLSGNSDYSFIDSKAQFEALADGSYELADGEKILGTFRNNQTLQQAREGEGMTPRLENVPELSTMAEGALNVLGQDEDGFFLMVEGGAVDWAAHANDTGRIIEEQVSFNDTVDSVVDWVETNSSWEETMVIVTTDHGNGLLLGPDGTEVAFQPVQNNGQGELPGVSWHTGNHTNELVPIWAKGPGAEALSDAATKVDPGLGNYAYNEMGYNYLDNTDVFDAMYAAMGLGSEQDAVAAMPETAINVNATAAQDELIAA